MATIARATLEAKFEEGCMSDVETCKRELRYNPKTFVRMVNEHGAGETARRLLADKHWPEGFTRLYLEKRLDLSLEAYIHNHPEFHEFFTSQQRAECDDRLRQVGYIK